MTVLLVKGMGFDLNKREFANAIKFQLTYDWLIDDIPSTCGELFLVDHAVICKRGLFITEHHNELCDLEADLLNLVCNVVEIKPVLQNFSGEQLSGGSNAAPVMRLVLMQ